MARHAAIPSVFGRTRSGGHSALSSHNQPTLTPSAEAMRRRVSRLGDFVIPLLKLWSVMVVTPDAAATRDCLYGRKSRLIFSAIVMQALVLNFV